MLQLIKKRIDSISRVTHRHMHVLGRHKTSRAFALPTVLIASIVLLMILAVSVTATAAVRTTLKNQYYVQLAQVAGESGVAMAKACLAANGNVPQWTDAKPLTPATDCSGNVVLRPTVKALVVAGGGSGGGSTGGGGGAGGYLYNEDIAISVASYPVSVGAGGSAVTQGTQGNSGTNSSFNGIISIGGGGGANTSGAGAATSGLSGGSGGGGQSFYGTPTLPPGNGTAGQGNNGGPGYSDKSNTGGGGGAGGAGTMGGSLYAAGNGGPGIQNNISGASVWYAGGGGGGNGNGVNTGIGGSNVGGNGDAGIGKAGAVNTGSGGGGGWNHNGGGGGRGADGIVIIAYPTNSGIVATGGTISTSGANKIHKFTATVTSAFVVTSVGTASCPSDPRCSVMVNGTLRSSFSVPKPAVDANGRATKIANNGYVEITRTSNGAVWRTYRQPSVQAAVVPDLCSGNATATRGWSAAVVASTQDALPSASSAQSIAMSVDEIPAGAMYFRKDFNVVDAGVYEVNAYTGVTPGLSSKYTGSAQNPNEPRDSFEVYVDSKLVTLGRGSIGTGTIDLTPGCHVIMARLVNENALVQRTDITASVTKLGAAANTAPLVVTDTSWRVSAGELVDFSTSNYYESLVTWDSARLFGVYNNPTTPWGTALSQWPDYSGDALANWIGTNYRSSSGDTFVPEKSYAWLRNTRTFTTTAQKDVRLTAYCDDNCKLYIDGKFMMDVAAVSGIVSKTFTIQPGTHTVGFRLYNGGGGPNPSALLFSALDLSTNAVLSRSDAGWDTTNFWTNSDESLSSYDQTFVPSPSAILTKNVKVLAVGGGGPGGGGWQGGGGGGGAVVYNAAYPITAGDYYVSVASGGAGGVVNPTSNGSSSTFDGYNIRAQGGGYGASEPSSNINSGYVYAGSGASGGGGSHGPGGIYYVGTGIIGIGNSGGTGWTNNPYQGGGGGGAGGAGGNAIFSAAGTGGVGVANPMLGSTVGQLSNGTYYLGGGGGGSRRNEAGSAGGLGGGGAGGNYGFAGATGFTNSGGGGGAGSNGGSAVGTGGNGGTGAVVISYPTNSGIVATGGIITYANGFTLHSFTAVGGATFKVTAIN